MLKMKGNYTRTAPVSAAELRGYIIYPSTRQVNLNRDSAGRLTSLTDAASANYLSSMSYNPAGQVTGLTLGNGAIETYGYDTNRMQLTSQTATKNSTSLMNLTYSYQASAGQNGAGTTAGNSGQVMTISGSINSTTESAAYTYDLLSRLGTSNQTTNGTSAQRRFAYDRWGNRTTTHDATSGGTQIQTITLQQSGGIPSNRISSVNNGGSFNYTYSYDNAGNVTNDGLHTYIYDAENRLVSVDSGATAQYTYDYKNRRTVKTVGTTITRYVWDDWQVIAEYDGSTGNLSTEFIYSGNRMIGRFAGGTTRYYLNDRLSERVVLDTNSAIVGRMGHLPYGEQFGTSGEQENHRFTSYERDSETGMDYAVNRYYSYSVGRFAESDPIFDLTRIHGGSRCGNNSKVLGLEIPPQQLNRYNFTTNDPTNRTDPLGLEDRSFDEVFSSFSVKLSPLPEENIISTAQDDCRKCCKQEGRKCTRNYTICITAATLAAITALVGCTSVCRRSPIVPPIITLIRCGVCIATALVGFISAIIACNEARNGCEANREKTCSTNIPGCSCK